MALNAVEWPEKLKHLVKNVAVVPGQDGKECCRIDIDVDADTLFRLNEFEARARHRQVQIRLPGSSGCLRGEMNTIIGLGSASDPRRHIGKVRVSFHDVVQDRCADDLY